MRTLQDSLDLLSKLDKRLIPMADEWFGRCRSRGLNIHVIETIRTLENQAKFVAAGLSQIKSGYHQRGLAIDFAIFDHNGVYQTNDLSGDYRIAGEIAESLGFVWGGRWKHLVDSDHIEMHLPEEPLVA